MRYFSRKDSEQNNWFAGLHGSIHVYLDGPYIFNFLHEYYACSMHYMLDTVSWEHRDPLHKAALTTWACSCCSCCELDFFLSLSSVFEAFGFAFSLALLSAFFLLLFWLCFLFSFFSFFSLFLWLRLRLRLRLALRCLLLFFRSFRTLRSLGSLVLLLLRVLKCFGLLNRRCGLSNLESRTTSRGCEGCEGWEGVEGGSSAIFALSSLSALSALSATAKGVMSSTASLASVGTGTSFCRCAACICSIQLAYLTSTTPSIDPHTNGGRQVDLVSEMSSNLNLIQVCISLFPLVSLLPGIR